MSRRTRIVVASVAALVVLVAGGFVYIRGGSTPVPVNRAVDRFRAATPAPTPTPDLPASESTRGMTAAAPHASAAPQAARDGGSAPSSTRPLPPEGVYVYATTGYDHVTVLGGSRHTYPDETTITVRHGGCGFTERWDVLAERWDERESCRTPGGDTLHRVTSYHEFFRQGDSRTFACEGFTYPVGAKPGDTWTTRCESDTTVATTTLRAVGWETVEVAGQRLETLHVHATTGIDGEQQGESQRDVWGSTDNGLVLRERAMIRSVSNQPAVGEVTYTESFEIRLTSLEPRT